MTDSPLRLARQARGWTQRQLAAASGLHQPDISHYEHGGNPSVLVALRVAAALETTVEALWSPNTERQRPTRAPQHGCV